jgi:phenylalanine-4-hydroxylase
MQSRFEIPRRRRPPMSSTPNRVESQLTDKGYVPIYTTNVVEQPWSSYSDEEHAVWATLFERQQKLLVGRASEVFLRNQQTMGMSPDKIPKFDDLNRALSTTTGWQIIGVEGLLPEIDFFEHLANRRFPVTWWIRRREQLDYLAEPDLFHDLFGHVPLLMEPVFADYMQAYGRGGVKAHAIGPDAIAQLARLYWYTVEFGLIREAGGLRIYGAGILSSKGESIYCLDSEVPNHLGFDLERIMRTRYGIDHYQRNYFVIDSYEQLMQATSPDFTPIYARLDERDAIAAGEVLAGDVVIQRGTGEGWAEAGSA